MTSSQRKYADELFDELQQRLIDAELPLTGLHRDLATNREAAIRAIKVLKQWMHDTNTGFWVRAEDDNTGESWG